jgi:putative transcriptional regulator
LPQFVRPSKVSGIIFAMAQILQSKNLATKFQILLEIAASQPNIQQKNIAGKLNITPQAVSEYVKDLISDGWLASQGRSRYQVTKEGVDWILKMARQLQSYCSFVNKVVSDISVSTAIAADNLSSGQSVSLYMKDGLLFASNKLARGAAKGIAAFEAKKGEDVGISQIEGVIELKMGEVIICKVPNVREGGSRNVDLARLKEELDKGRLVGAIGNEALITLKSIGAKPDYRYGVKEAMVEAVSCGQSFLVVCTEDVASEAVRGLEEENLEYKIVDLILNKQSIET